MWLLFALALTWGIFAWFRPRHAILSFPLLLPAYLLRADFFGLPTTLLELTWFSTLLSVTLRLGREPWRLGWSKLHAWLPALILWSLASAVAVVVAPDHLAALGLWRAYFLEPILFFILLCGLLETAQERRWLISALIGSVAFVALWSIIQFATNHGIPSPWNTELTHRRATGPFPFPNALSLYAAPITALLLGLSFTKSNLIAPKFSALGAAAGTLATILAKSVGGFLGILASGSLALFTQPKLRKYLFGLAALSIILILAIPPIRTPVVQNLTFQKWSGQVRLFIWRETWQMLKDRPILGAGLGAYPTVFKPYHKATAIEIFQYPHNILLNLWSELGLLGIGAFAWLCVLWFRTARRTHWIYLLPLVAILIQGLVDVPYFKNDLAFMFWILAALPISAAADPQSHV